MFTEALEDILRDHCTPATVRAIEDGGDPMPLWATIADSGFLELLAPESAGGAALPPEEFFPVLLVLGRHAVPLPVAQSMVARALLPDGACPAGLLTIAPAVRRETDHWLCPQVPFGSVATQLLADDGQSLLVFDCADAERLPSGVAHGQSAGLRLRGEPRRFARPGDALRAWGAAMQSALLAGAMGRAFEMTLQYGNDRSQFGKSIGKFQAVQHQLAVMAEQVAAARLAAQAAFVGTRDGRPGLLQAAMAKARTSEAVVPVAAIAHAVHGAIGVTAEYDLQLFTRRLHEGRMAYGSEAHWHPLLGRALLDSGLPAVDFVRGLAVA
ncbi:acyl-CoA dehydrogenase [Xylophilus sp. Kf1]|nr:acyl-CoA dehydrogenase [Xylophilus sp. Kf1]